MTSNQPDQEKRSGSEPMAYAPLTSLQTPIQAACQLAVLDELINSGKTILYKGRDFHEHQVVESFVKDHRSLSSAMLGVRMYAYSDPCGCCIPAYGQRNIQSTVSDLDAVINIVQTAKSKGNALDILFLNERLYLEANERIKEAYPETKLIVACERGSTSNASELRQRGIPAIDNNDYMNCSPLNAVIALTLFGELMAGES